MSLRKDYLAELLLIGILLLASLPVGAIESGLLGIQIGATPRNLMETYGQPSGVIFPAGNGLALNTMRQGMMQASGNTPPEWAKAIWPSRLNADQQMWIYQLKGEVVAGFIIKGTGDAAMVTDIIAASFKPNSKVKTEGGVKLGDSLSRVLLNYGYPPLLQPFVVGATTRAAATPTVNRRLSATNMPNFGRVSGPEGRVTTPRGSGPVPPMSTAPATSATSPGSAGRVVVVDQRPISFTKNCVILYNGLIFTLYDFKVVRIQVTQ